MSTLALNSHTPVDASAGPVSMVLPVSASNGDEVSCEKYDATANVVTITGNVRGTAGASITLSLVNETVGFRARVASGTTSWWPLSGHKTLSSLRGQFAGRRARPVLVGAHVPLKIRKATLIPTLTVESLNGIPSARTVTVDGSNKFVRLCAGSGFRQITSNGWAPAYRDPIAAGSRDPMAAELFHDGTDVSFQVTSAPGHQYKFWVDDELITSWDGVTGTNNGAILNLRLSFDEIDHRKIRLEQTNGDLRAILCGPNDTIRATSPKGPRVFFMTDSYGGGAGSGTTGYTAINSWIYRLAALLGWDDALNGGVGGTGWISRNSGATNNYQDRVATNLTVAAAEPGGLDVVVFQGGKNDYGSGAAAIGAAAGATLAATRALLPRALLVVTGPVAPGSPTTGASDPTWLPIQTAIFNAVAPYADIMIDTMTAPIFTGTGTVGATTGSGNGDVLIQSDGTHPTPRGARVLGHSLTHGLLVQLTKVA